MTGLLSRLSPRHRFGRTRGFSLVELLLVLAIIGIISAIAIPAYLGQRTRARVIGDAVSNAKVLAMALESYKAENGNYGAIGNYTWTNGVADSKAAILLPSFTPNGNSRMNFTLQITGVGLTYQLTVIDPSISTTTVVYQTDQSGAVLARLY